MNDIQFMKFCKVQDNASQPVRSILVCNDGFTFSCQASETHYCIPKKNGLPAKDYKAWEIGYPSGPDDIIFPFVEDYHVRTDAGHGRKESDSVYPYVHTDIVIQLIESHGGLKCP